MVNVQCESVFITGCNRAIGLEFVKQFAKLPQAPKYIFATCRSLEDESTQELHTLSYANSNLHLLELDVDDETAIREIAKKIGEKLGDCGLDILINNAATVSKAGLEEATVEDMLVQYRTNTVGPLIVAQAMLPLLRVAAKSDKTCCPKPKVVNITSRFASISDNTSGGWYASRASKAALNIVTKSMAIDLASEGILALALHPGYVKTRMTGPQACITTETSVKGMMEVIGSLDETKSGTFMDYKGNTIPW